MRILLLGKNGQLGWEANRCLAVLGEMISLDYPEIDFSKPSSLQSLVDEIKPDIIFNAAAYTAVDQAESEPEVCRLINAEAPGILASAARKNKCVLIHFSTDYVFDGAKGTPYEEQDQPNPLNVYGKTKLDGEHAVTQNGEAYIIIRTSWVYSLRGNNFITKVQQWARQQPVLRIVSDQVSGPTWARLLAECSSMIIAQSLPAPLEWFTTRRGIYHLAGNGYASRLEWAQEILRLTTPGGSPLPEILPARTSDFPSPATRPLVSVLSNRKFFNTFHISLPDWKLALKLAIGQESALQT